MATRTTWTTAPTWPTPTRQTTTRTARETLVTMTTTTMASPTTETTADWRPTKTSWTLMVRMEGWKQTYCSHLGGFFPLCLSCHCFSAIQTIMDKPEYSIPIQHIQIIKFTDQTEYNNYSRESYMPRVRTLIEYLMTHMPAHTVHQHVRYLPLAFFWPTLRRMLRL